MAGSILDEADSFAAAAIVVSELRGRPMEHNSKAATHSILGLEIHERREQQCSHV